LIKTTESVEDLKGEAMTDTGPSLHLPGHRFQLSSDHSGLGLLSF